MYKSQRHNHSFGRPNGTFRNGKARNFQKSKPKYFKKLDINLFIKKATPSNMPEKTASNASFSDYAIADKIKQNIALRQYSTPTEIQQKVIPYVLQSKDVIGIANTGTGKTAAFLIPLINKTYNDRNERVLIVAPTRELAIQITDEFYIFAKGINLEAALCIGGASIKRQVRDIRHNPHFVIGTPGRLKDLIEKRQLNLALFHNIVLDEVDRMLDIGFINDIKYLISFLPKKRQSLFFSATVDNRTKEIVQSFVTNPVTVSVKQHDTAENIDQNIIRVQGGGAKIEKLHDLLIQKEFNKVLIFGRTKWGMEKLTHALIERGFKVASIHGNKSQNQRQRALQEFKNNQIQILTATDVASRGIDIEDVTHVINYDTPASYEDYIHRIGRTGRAGKRGTALTFVE